MGGVTATLPSQRAKRRPEDTHISLLIREEDWRPADHQFSDEEMRDRFMRYGGVDARTAWRMVAFIRGEQGIDWQSVLDSGAITFGAT